MGIERLTRIGPAVDVYEVAGARVHRQARLGREVEIVPLDQLVDVAETPALRERSPRVGKPFLVAVVLGADKLARFCKACLVVGDLQFDLAEPSHPRKRSADCADGGVCAGSKVAPAPLERLAGDRTLDEIGLERLSLETVARRLRSRDSLPHDRFPLASIHGASVPAVGEVEGQIRDEELDAERDARRHLALAQIRQYPDPALRREAKPVEEFDDDLGQLVERMKALMVDAVGVGLAATQVGIVRRLFVFDRGDGQGSAALVNPVIADRSEEVETAEEGCLSLQGVLVPVERSATVRIAGKDERGKDVSYDLEANPARCVQHELDHLDGVLIIDRTTPEARREALATLRPRVVLR